jgi:dethiobiotin synthetase
MTGYFITGTDTGVGKTRVAAALARGLRRAGRRVLAVKPVQSGSDDDAAALADAAGHDPCCYHRFPLPLAPAVAAEAAGIAIELPELRDRVAADAASRDADLVIVEGAGGLLCPLAGSATMADLAAAIGLPLLVVARASLGTINHSLLTLAEATRRGLAVTGIILSEIAPEHGPDEASNPIWIERLSGVPVLARLGHGAHELPSSVIDRLGAHSSPRKR